jgi:hypothetical protein
MVIIEFYSTNAVTFKDDASLHLWNQCQFDGSESSRMSVMLYPKRLLYLEIISNCYRLSHMSLHYFHLKNTSSFIVLCTWFVDDSAGLKDIFGFCCARGRWRGTIDIMESNWRDYLGDKKDVWKNCFYVLYTPIINKMQNTTLITHDKYNEIVRTLIE